MQQSDALNDLTVNELRVTKEQGYFGPGLVITMRLPGTSAATEANYDAAVFIADRDYEWILTTERHTGAGTDAGSVALTMTRLPDGTAMGSGISISPNPAFNMKAAADTLQSARPLTGAGNDGIPYKVIPKNHAIGFARAGTFTAVAGVIICVYLRSI